MENVRDIIQEQAGYALQRLNAQGNVTAERVAESVLSQVVYWEDVMPNGDILMFVRLFSPVVQREEVFLGNILYNAFLSKAFIRATSDLGKLELVANDLESYYFLVQTKSDVTQLARAFRAEVERSLPHLFFGKQNEEHGIYGDLRRMFTFTKSDFEPFPVYVVPHFLAKQLEKAIRSELDELLKPAKFSSHIKTVLATMAFFYGQTSGGNGDAQSPANFIDHLANERNYDGLIKVTDVKKAFNIEVARKPNIKESIDKQLYGTDNLRQLLSEVLHLFFANIDKGFDKWFMGALRKDEKFLNLSESEYLDEILTYIQLGAHILVYRPKSSIDGETVRCTVCGTFPSRVRSSMVVMGITVFAPHNQSLRQVNKELPRVCIRCALHSYLGQKLLGTRPRSIGGTPPKLPMVPKTYNLIFHYGRHTDDDIVHLTQRIDLIWNLVQQHRSAESTRLDIEGQRKLLIQKAERASNVQKKQALTSEIAQKEVELQQAQSAVAQAKVDILAACPWLKETGASPGPAENPSLDIWANIQFSETKAEQHVLGLGMSGYRMILFVLPQIRPPRDAKENDFAQRRFSNSRLTVFALLSFLRETCGCDGPFYYQSLPLLTPDAFQHDTFYVRNETINVQQAQKEYEVVTQFAWKLVKKRSSKGFVEKLILSEKLLSDPLGTVAGIMRDSPILGIKNDPKQKFKRLAGGWRNDWKAQDLTEYAKFIQYFQNLRR